MLPAKVQTAVRKVAGDGVSVQGVKRLSGGTINQSFHVSLDSGKELFIKHTPDDACCPGMFEAEAAALALIAKSGALRVPDTLYADEHCLVQAMFQQGHRAQDWHEQIGRGLAELHRRVQAQGFGFERDNYLGTSPQSNRSCDSWLDFWRDRRLEPQISRLHRMLGHDDALLQTLSRLGARLDTYLAAWAEPPVFIHGDLWSGNATADENGSPIVFDPAAYFASREAEFGMMRLFGGFGPRTEAAYAEIWPFESGFETRVEIYRLYHIVNHLIIFGQSYYAEALAVGKSLL